MDLNSILNCLFTTSFCFVVIQTWCSIHRNQ